MEQMQLSTFQKDISSVIESVRVTEKPVLITRNGESLVKIVPVLPADTSWLGCMRSTGKIFSDIVSPAAGPEVWEVLSQ